MTFFSSFFLFFWFALVCEGKMNCSTKNHRGEMAAGLVYRRHDGFYHLVPSPYITARNTILNEVLRGGSKPVSDVANSSILAIT